MYIKTPPNISQSAKGLFKLKHFVLVILVFWKNPGCSCSQSSCSCCSLSWRVTAQEHPALALCQGISAKIGTKRCFTELWCISETQNDYNPSVVSSTRTQAFAFLVKHLIWNISVFFHHWTHTSPTQNRRIWNSSSFFFFRIFFFN